jgi:hypothetical protein
MTLSHQFSVGEIKLLAEALAARADPSNAGVHERKAEAMRNLRAKLMHPTAGDLAGERHA